MSKLREPSVYRGEFGMSHVRKPVYGMSALKSSEAFEGIFGES